MHVLGCAGVYWDVLGCTWVYWAVLGCAGVWQEAVTKLHWGCVLLGCTGVVPAYFGVLQR